MPPPSLDTLVFNNEMNISFIHNQNSPPPSSLTAVPEINKWYWAQIEATGQLKIVRKRWDAG